MLECGNFDKGVGKVGKNEGPCLERPEWQEEGRLFIKSTAADILEALRVGLVVKHEDGAEHEVGDGILLEFDENDDADFYTSTNRPETLFMAYVKICEEICYLGLAEEFEEFLTGRIIPGLKPREGGDAE